MTDKNSLIGFGLLLALMILYFYMNSPSANQIAEQKKKDSIENLKAIVVPKLVTDSVKPLTVLSRDSNASIPEQLITLENNDVKITYSNKGGFAREIELKKYKGFNTKPLMLLKGDNNSMDFAFQTATGVTEHSKNYTFIPTLSSDKKSLQLVHPNITLVYTIPDQGYMVNMKVNPTQASKTGNLEMEWTATSQLTEQDSTSQLQNARLCYNLEKEGYDYYTISENSTKEWNEGVNWLCFKQQYFNTSLITNSKIISSAKVTTKPSVDTGKNTLTHLSALMKIPSQNSLDFKWYVGPNEYKTLKSYKIGLEEIIPLSYGPFGFITYINKWIIIPIFNWLSTVFKSYGVVILLLTIILRLLMSPFNYKSYVSSAKMKALKPDLDALKEKLGDDKQAYGVEQMKLYREAGVNPLGGCLPALLQLPVFFALLSFFPNAIELRQQPFLWAKDLSTYDSILNLPFNIPFYGNHVSLFTILFVITSLLVSLYSMNMNMGDQSNPMLKYMPFIMPVMFLGIFNTLPASLTFYYCVSNLITLAIQFVIQNYIIDPDKIHAQIQAKRSEPPKENKLMKRMMEIQQQNQGKMKKK